MSTVGQDESGARGRPRELYTFGHGNSVWRFTSDSSGTPLATTQGIFQPIYLKRGPIELSPDLARNPITIEIDRDEDVPALFKASNPSQMVSVIISRVHEVMTDAGESSYPSNPIVIWTGRVLSVSWSSTVATMECETSSTSLRRLMLRRRWQRSCPYVLFGGTTCKVSAAGFTLGSAVSSVSNSSVTLGTTGGHEDDYYAGGKLTYQEPSGLIHERMIRSQTGTTLLLTYPIIDMPVGASVTLTAGCNHTTDHCTLKLNNLQNYGGQPFIPDRRPFGGTQVF